MDSFDLRLKNMAEKEKEILPESIDHSIELALNNLPEQKGTVLSLPKFIPKLIDVVEVVVFILILTLVPASVKYFTDNVRGTYEQSAFIINSNKNRMFDTIFKGRNISAVIEYEGMVYEKEIITDAKAIKEKIPFEIKHPETISEGYSLENTELQITTYEPGKPQYKVLLNYGGSNDKITIAQSDKPYMSFAKLSTFEKIKLDNAYVLGKLSPDGKISEIIFHSDKIYFDISGTNLNKKLIEETVKDLLDDKVINIEDALIYGLNNTYDDNIQKLWIRKNDLINEITESVGLLNKSYIQLELKDMPVFTEGKYKEFGDLEFCKLLRQLIDRENKQIPIGSLSPLIFINKNNSEFIYMYKRYDGNNVKIIFNKSNDKWKRQKEYVEQGKSIDKYLSDYKDMQLISSKSVELESSIKMGYVVANTVLEAAGKSEENQIYNINKLEEFIDNYKNGKRGKIRIIKYVSEKDKIWPNKLLELETDGIKLGYREYDTYSNKDVFTSTTVDYNLIVIGKSETSGGFRYELRDNKAPEKMGITLISFSSKDIKGN